MDKKGYVFKALGAESINEVMEFLREHFYENEPIAIMVDLCPKGYRIPAQEKEICGYLKKNISFGMFNLDDELIGLVIVDDLIKDGSDKRKVDNDVEEDLNVATCSCSQMPKQLIVLNRFLHDIETNYGRESDLHSVIGAEKIMDVFIVGVDPAEGQKGYGTILLQECEKRARILGYDAVKCIGSSYYTQRICSKLGYQSLFRIKFEDYEMDGEKVFKKDLGVHSDAVMLYKLL